MSEAEQIVLNEAKMDKLKGRFERFRARQEQPSHVQTAERDSPERRQTRSR